MKLSGALLSYSCRHTISFRQTGEQTDTPSADPTPFFNYRYHILGFPKTSGRRYIRFHRIICAFLNKIFRFGYIPTPQVGNEHFSDRGLCWMLPVRSYCQCGFRVSVWYLPLSAKSPPGGDKLAAILLSSSSDKPQQIR